MQIKAPDDDTEALTGYGSWGQTKSNRKQRCFSIRIALEGIGVVALLALLCFVIALSVRLRGLQGNIQISPECIHALGGGPVGPGGSIHPVTPDKCIQQLHSYGQHAYWHEVELAAQDAMDVFNFTANSVHSSQATVLETESSNGSKSPASLWQFVTRSLLTVPKPSRQGAAIIRSSVSSRSCLGGPRHCDAADRPTAAAAATTSSQAGPPGPASKQPPKQLVIFDIDETILSNLPQILDPETWPWDKWVAAAQAGPLPPMLKFYQELCRHGYAVAMVTGRREAARNSTMLNLERAGYGMPCISSTDSRAAQQHSSGSGISSTGSDGSGSGSSEADAPACCYEALFMRPTDDTRLASVYKPWARKQLLASGHYELVALLGDQFSDLNGEGIAAGMQVYKLPNPFYFIL